MKRKPQYLQARQPCGSDANLQDWGKSVAQKCKTFDPHKNCKVAVWKPDKACAFIINNWPKWRVFINARVGTLPGSSSCTDNDPQLFFLILFVCTSPVSLNIELRMFAETLGESLRALHTCQSDTDRTGAFLLLRGCWLMDSTRACSCRSNSDNSSSMQGSSPYP